MLKSTKNIPFFQTSLCQSVPYKPSPPYFPYTSFDCCDIEWWCTYIYYLLLYYLLLMHSPHWASLLLLLQFIASLLQVPFKTLFMTCGPTTTYKRIQAQFCLLGKIYQPPILLHDSIFQNQNTHGSQTFITLHLCTYTNLKPGWGTFNYTRHDRALSLNCMLQWTLITLLLK